MIGLEGKKIWLVGASAGIGEALAHRLAGEGADIALSARSMGKLDELARALPPGRHMALPLDVTSEANIALAWEQMTAQWDIPDMVIYNAGAYDPLSAKTFDLRTAQAMTDVNFGGALRILSHVLPAFLSRGTGAIILVGSVAAYSGLPNSIGYGASKAALMHLAEDLHVDLANTNVAVQLVSPGFVRTRLTEKNKFPMPFIMEAGEAAARIVQGLKSERFEIAFPKRFCYILKFLRLLPYPLYFRLLKLMKIAD